MTNGAIGEVELAQLPRAAAEKVDLVRTHLADGATVRIRRDTPSRYECVRDRLPFRVEGGAKRLGAQLDPASCKSVRFTMARSLKGAWERSSFWVVPTFGQLNQVGVNGAVEDRKAILSGPPKT